MADDRTGFGMGMALAELEQARPGVGRPMYERLAREAESVRDRPRGGGDFASWARGVAASARRASEAGWRVAALAAIEGGGPIPPRPTVADAAPGVLAALVAVGGPCVAAEAIRRLGSLAGDDERRARDLAGLASRSSGRWAEVDPGPDDVEELALRIDAAVDAISRAAVAREVQAAVAGSLEEATAGAGEAFGCDSWPATRSPAEVADAFESLCMLVVGRADEGARGRLDSAARSALAAGGPSLVELLTG